MFQSKEHTFRGHGDSVDQLVWHPVNPDQLATASGDRTIRIWDTRSSKSAATVNTKGTSLTSLNLFVFEAVQKSLPFVVAVIHSHTHSSKNI